MSLNFNVYEKRFLKFNCILSNLQRRRPRDTQYTHTRPCAVTNSTDSRLPLLSPPTPTYTTEPSVGTT